MGEINENYKRSLKETPGCVPWEFYSKNDHQSWAIRFIIVDPLTLQLWNDKF